MTPRTQSVWEWLERALIAAGLVLCAWSIIAAAQTHFYASLPVPATAHHIRTLPGDAADSAVPEAAATTTGSIRPGDWVAKLEAPSVGLSATVIEGSTDTMLARAAGHIEETAYPGQPGNVGIAGHRDTTFRAVRNLHVGDRIRLTTTAGVFDYRIARTFIVTPDDVSVLDPTGQPSLTLVTCYPFTFIGHAPKRYIVRAELEKPPGTGRTPADAARQTAH